MAYFANGTEGMILDEQCSACLIPDDAPCPILLVQMHYNYDQVVDGGLDNDLAKAINMLVNEKGQCQMKLILDETRKEKVKIHNLTKEEVKNFWIKE